MADRIKLLPEVVANQIAAGEVVNRLAKQALTSFRKVFEDKKSMGIVGAGYSDYDADYIFAMVEL